MVTAICSIIAALLPFLVDYLQQRQKGQPYETLQTIRKAAETGEVDALAQRISRLRRTDSLLRAANDLCQGQQPSDPAQAGAAVAG